MQYSRKVIWSLTLLMLAFQCIKKQSHEIAAPETPYYTVSGRVTDIDTDTGLSKIEVCFRPREDEMIFDCPLEDQLTVSDSTGVYRIELCPGNYTLIARRENYPVLEQRLTLTKTDRIIDLPLPMPLVTRVVHHFAGICGICPKNTVMYALGAATQIGERTVYRVLEGSFRAGFSLLGDHAFSPENPVFQGLAFDGRNYFAAGGTLAVPQILTIDPVSGQVSGTFPLPYRLADLTFDGHNLWGIAQVGKIFQFQGASADIAREFPTPDKYPAGIAWNGQQIISSDASTNFVYFHDPNLAVQQTWRPVYFTETNLPVALEDISHLAADSTGYLYLVRGDSLYTFLVD